MCGTIAFVLLLSRTKLHGLAHQFCASAKLRARAGEGLTKHLGEAQNGSSKWLEPNADSGHLVVPFRTCDLIAIHEKTDMHANMHKMWAMVRVLFTPWKLSQLP